LSKGVEQLAGDWKQRTRPYDVVIVGSGYGGAVAARRLASSEHGGQKLDVCVLERGREHLPGTFPNSFSELPGHVRFSRADDPVARGVRDGLFDLRIGADVSVLVASGLGGGSLINAGVALRPDNEVFMGEWPSAISNELKTGKKTLRWYLRLAKEKLELQNAQTGKLEKHKQFMKLVHAHHPEKASITVGEKACENCGDCATGCNFGAKHTLATTYLKKAWKYGAEMYTGATVSHLERKDGRWAVYVGHTSEPRPLKKAEETLLEIQADTVILAAGTFGSTEILMRTKARCPDFRVSERLGERFSTNGDMISVVYRPAHRANAAPEESKQLDERHVGPTITGFARTGNTCQKGVVIEELAIPGALRRVFEELVTTSLMLERFGKRDRTDHRPISERDPARAAGEPCATPRIDPAAVDPCVIERCQVFAAMGDDGAKGRLELVPGWNDAGQRREIKDGAIRVHWPEAGKEKVYERQEAAILALLDPKRDVYLRNPLWQPLPASLSKHLSGEKPTGLLFSVHPLGGCRMGDDVSSGVVNHVGEVFNPADGKPHPGLLVLDGSIIPTALGVNPMLTITALAERAMAIYRPQRGWTDRTVANPPRLPDLPPIPKRGAAQPVPTALEFSERMTGDLKLDGARPVPAELTVQFEKVPDLLAFLRDPLHPLGIRPTSTLRVRDPNAPAHAPLPEARVEGEAELLVRGATGWTARALNALFGYAQARGLADLRAKLDERGTWVPDSPVVSCAVGWLWRRLLNFLLILPVRQLLELLSVSKLLEGYVDLASRVGEVRYLTYKLKLLEDLQDSAGRKLLAKGTRIKGRKTLAYYAGSNPWRQLVDLDLMAYPPESEKKLPFELGTLSVDPAYFFKGFQSRLQVAGQRDLPSAWMDLASLGAFIARIVLKIHFWSFRLPEYQKYDPMRDVRRLPGPLGDLLMERHMVGYPESPRDAGVFLPVTRYRKQDKPPLGPVVLFHGLGSGGIQFATPWVEPNMAQYLAERGFDVWVAELRTSIALPYSLDQWSLDEVARGDIARIIDKVLEKTGKPQTKVVAHCIGSAMFCTAVLDGRLQDTAGRSKVESAVLLQVGPLITLSPGTRLRGLVTAPLRRFFPSGHVDFSVDSRAGWVESLIDRLLTTYPYPPAEAKHHRLGWSLEHNSHIANCNRWAAIDGRMFQHGNLTEQMLGRLGEVLGHSSLTTWTQTIQYAFLERLTDSEGRNAYVTAENVRRYFTFPVRFLHGRENDVFLPLTSLRSQELLKAVHGAGYPGFVKIMKGYGHFDPLIGKNAGSRVFPAVSGFLRRTWTWQPKAKAGPKHYFLRRPLVGPVLGWVREEAAGKWCARIWCRIDDLRSPMEFVVLRVLKDGQAIHSRAIPDASYRRPPGHIESLVAGPIDTTLSVDVVLPDGKGEYEIVVLSAHEALEGAPDKRLHRAEIAAGKARSAAQPHLTIEQPGAPLGPQLAQSAQIQAYLAQSPYRPGDQAYDEKIDRATVTIPASDKAATLELAIASCRYPGGVFDREQADAVFRELKDRLKAARPDALVLLGDQIYADATAGAFDPKDRKERFYDAYREAWTAPNAQHVMSRVPVYMMMDDHEAGNDWHPEDELGEDDREMREEGLKAFKHYQWVHSPGNDGQSRRLPDGRQVFDYRFTLRGFPVFVCDPRSGRSGRARMLDPGQFDDLKRWLQDLQKDQNVSDRPKFVVSPSVVVPFLRPVHEDPARAEIGRAVYPTRSDGWDGFPDQLVDLFAFIASEKINNVVFLCGDSHLSMRSEISFTDAHGNALPISAWCVMASPMYAPYPFANGTPGEYLDDNHQSPLKLRGAGWMRYKVTQGAAHNSFAHVTARETGGKWEVSAQFHSPGAPAVPPGKEQKCPPVIEDDAVDAGIRHPLRSAA
jgi:choline dehydrogenase-like flavoprotein